ncbi:MAG TPA: AarF/ABC1/UbiB kinase family protein [Candidatus Pseudogracilibacillus intestinigallinarum]|uniref:AarF/ABC1/UbiB kinase family protein n=1 Tax=Candidatus Pseudogracilibacillus intestinigallinarum TaxID=2838742 RepID=A0A9D1PNJ4_9BACI|nr:AarF/ABC1/UbiB kinase family protein [Candidatus Pseudogracilibacillus intestinigallinarum]
MFRRRMKHTQRFQEVLNTFLKNGFSHFLFRIGLTDRKKYSETSDMNLQDIGSKLRDTLQQLGPTFIKLGQIASSRNDLIPKEITDELEKLQDDVFPIPYEKIEATLEEELHAPIHVLFAHFNIEPIATASIGQVHIATLHTGEEVAVKIQRPSIETTMQTDLEILHDFSKFLEDHFAWARAYQIRDMVDEFAFSLKNELDYMNEGRNAEKIAKQLADNEAVHVPIIYWQYTTKKVLTMEMIHGIKVNNYDKLEAHDYDKRKIAKTITDAMFEQIFIDGFFHGDPHPGNIYILPMNRVVFLDFGMVGQLTEEMRYHFTSLVINLQLGNAKGIVKTFGKLGMMTSETDRSSLLRDVEYLIAKYYDIPMKQIKLGAVIKEVFDIAYEHELQLPNEISILGKTIITIEKIISGLDPTFSIMSAVEPFGKRLIQERMQPSFIAKKTWEQVMDNAEILSELPQDVKDVATTLKKGKLRFDINVSDLPFFMRRLDKISNRLSFSIILLSFCILMVGLIVGAAISGQTTLLWRLPVIEIGSVIAFLLFLLILFSIFRSGRM